jgi:hypothetical protein
MEKQRRHIDDLFRERLQSYEEREDGAVWAQLKDRLLEYKYGKRPPVWRWVALMLVFTIFTTFCLTGENSAVTVATQNGGEQTDHSQKPGNNNNTRYRQHYQRSKTNIIAEGAEPIAEVTARSAAGSDEIMVDSEPTTDMLAKIAAETSLELGYQSLFAALDATAFHSLTIVQPQQQIKAISVAGLLKLNTPEATMASIAINATYRQIPQAGQPDYPIHLVAAAGHKPIYFRLHDKDIFWAAKNVPSSYQTVSQVQKTASIPEGKTKETVAAPALVQSEDIPTTGKSNRRRYFDEVGVKASAGSRLSTIRSTDVEASVYLRKHLNKKLSLSIEPGGQYHSYAQKELNRSSYYSITSNNVDSFAWLSVPKNWQPTTNYVFNQSYDSVVVSSRVARSSWEFALPVMLSYNLNDKLSIAGGPVLFIGKGQEAVEDVRIYKHEITDSVMELISPLSSTETQNHFVHTVPEYNQSQLFSPNRGVNFRAGFMLSLSWMLDSRWHLSLTTQQTVLGLRGVTNATMRNALGAPIIRIGLGWRLY